MTDTQSEQQQGQGQQRELTLTEILTFILETQAHLLIVLGSMAFNAGDKQTERSMQKLTIKVSNLTYYIKTLPIGLKNSGVEEAPYSKLVRFNRKSPSAFSAAPRSQDPRNDNDSPEGTLHVHGGTINNPKIHRANLSNIQIQMHEAWQKVMNAWHEDKPLRVDRGSTCYVVGPELVAALTELSNQFYTNGGGQS